MQKHVIVLVPSLAIGGQERQAVLWAESLNKICDCTIVVFERGDVEYISNVNVINLNLPSSQNIIIKVFHQIERAYRLNRIRKKQKIDAVISYGDTANLTNVLSFGKGETVLSLRTSVSAEYSILKNWMYRLCDKIICQTHAMNEILNDNFEKISKKVVIQNNIFDLKTIKEKANEPCDLLKKDCVNLVAVGRLDKFKCYKHLLKVYKYVNERNKNTRLIIVGDGVEKPSLIELAEKLNLEKSVVFVGNAENPFAYMKKSDIFIMSSYMEGFPNVMVEAMACGLPIISTDCYTGPREILSTDSSRGTGSAKNIERVEYGILTPSFISDNSEERIKEKILAMAIIELIENENERRYYSEKSLIRAEDFSIKLFEKKVRSLMENAERM